MAELLAGAVPLAANVTVYANVIVLAQAEDLVASDNPVIAAALFKLPAAATALLVSMVVMSVVKPLLIAMVSAVATLPAVIVVVLP
jgi:hypothetical protein